MASKNSILLLFLFALGLFLAGCSDDDDVLPDYTMIKIEAGTSNLDSVVQASLILVEEGGLIEFGEGTFNFTVALDLSNKDCITIRGAGTDKTTLDFSGQTSGAEGMLFDNTNGVSFEDFRIIDTGGDAIKVTESSGITFQNISVEWSGVADESNGAYGLYPVRSSNILIDGCYVRGASDAGIYVGQSEYIHARNSVVEENVAGLEIENCNYSEVYNITARNNTGGILVFDLPDLSLKNGMSHKVYNNTLESNDYRNFAPAGNFVGNVPSGTGLMIMSAKNVEIYNNSFLENNVMGLGIYKLPDPGYFWIGAI